MAIQLSTRRPALRFELLEDRAVPATLLVDDDKAQFKGPSVYTTIQAAVDAASAGDTILVARGVYTEQVTFADDKDGITLRAQNPKQAIIRAPETLSGLNAIVTVDGADDVTIRGFTITGGGAATGPTYGVVVDGGSATVRDNLITGIRNSPLDGVQTGIAVAVLGDLEPAAAVISNNTLTDYQKGGVVVFGADATATVSGNTIVGAGPTDRIAQNGVQISDGADGYVFENLITGNDYTGDEDVSAAGVYADTAGTVIVADNKVFENQTGVLLVNLEFVVVAGNRVFDSTRDGVDFVGVRGGLFADNRVEDSGVDGVYLGDTTNLVVTGNRIRNNGDNGLEVTDGSSGNVIFGNTLRGNAGFDAFDDTTGGRTAGTANFWFFNRIGTKNNGGLG